MLVEFLKKIKSSCPWIWYGIEWGNGLIIKTLYGHKIQNAIEASVNSGSPYSYRQLTIHDAEMLVALIERQPEGFDRFFKPHPFDLRSFKRVLTNGTFILIGAFDDGKLVGYCFIRFFVNKSAYRGRLVDFKYQGRGIAKQMNKICADTAFEIGFRLFETVSNDNIASLKSAMSSGNIKIVKELPDNYLYLEILKG